MTKQWIGPVTAMMVVPWSAGQTGPPTFDSSASIGAGEVFEVAQASTLNPMVSAGNNHARVGGYMDTPTTDVSFTGDRITCQNLAYAGNGALMNSGKDVHFVGAGGVPSYITIVAYGLGADGLPKMFWVPKAAFEEKSSIKPDFKQQLWTASIMAYLDDTLAWVTTDASGTAATVTKLTAALIDNPASSPSALTATFSPADGATGINAATAIPTITFNQALDGGTLAGSVMLVRQDTKAVIPCSVSFQDTAKKVLQLCAPGAPGTPIGLTASTKTYQIIIQANRIASYKGDLYAGSETTFVTT